MSKPVIAVAFYSTWGHVEKLAESVIKGVEASGAVCKPYVFQETLSEEILTKMHAGGSLKPKYPVLKPDDLKEIDGLIIGAPTRYGRVPAQVSAFFDACGQLWATGALVGKFVTLFTSAAGQHGGHETTALTTMPFFVHHGMCYVPIGYVNSKLSGLDEVMGGSAYGASTVSAGDGSRQPLPVDLEVAEFQGKYFSDFVGTFVRGKQRAAGATTTGTSAGRVAPTLAPVVGTNTKTESKPVVEETPAAAEGEKEGYTVPKEQGETASTPATAPPAADTTAPAPAPAAEQAAAAPAAAPAPKATGAPAAKSEKKEKKGGLFASCCGGRGIED